jgi:hypothetical protein
MPRLDAVVSSNSRAVTANVPFIEPPLVWKLTSRRRRASMAHRLSRAV